MSSFSRLYSVILSLVTIGSIAIPVDTYAKEPIEPIIQPRIYDWQMRLTKALPELSRRQACSLAKELGTDTTPEQIQERVSQLDFDLDRTPLELFVAIKILLAQNQIIRNKCTEIKQCKRSIQTCESYMERLEDHRPGKKPKVIVAQENGYELLPDDITLPQWSQIVRLPYFDETTSQSDLNQYRTEAQSIEHNLQELKHTLIENLEQIGHPSHNIRRYILTMCDRLDPQTCLPYRDKKPTIIYSSPINIQPLKSAQVSSKATNDKL